jgi:type II secretory pathway component PulJ
MQNRKIRGYTLFEVGISLMLLALILQAVYLVAGNIYTYVSHTGKTLDSRNEAYRIFAIVKKDIIGSSGISISADNSSLIIRKSGGNVEYYPDNGKLARKTSAGVKFITNQKFEDVIWSKDKETLTVCLSVPYKGFGKKKSKPIRIIENFETGGGN